MEQVRCSEETWTGRWDCLVEITRPAGRTPWWRVGHSGTQVQVAAALDELAVRIDIDHWTRVLSALDCPLVGYDLTLRRADTDFVVDHAAGTVPIDTVPTVLHIHATGLRTRFRG